MLSNQKNKIPKFRNAHEDPIQYLEVYFRVGYYLCIVPFRFEKESSTSSAATRTIETDKFTLKRQWVQKIICYMVYTWSLYTYIPSMYSTKFNRTKISSFDIVALMTSFGSRTTFIYFVVMRQCNFLAIINSICKDPLLAKNPVSLNNTFYGRQTRNITWLFGALIIFYTCIGALYTLVGVSVVELQNWSPMNIWAAYVGQAKFNLFLKERNDAVRLNETSVADHVGTSIYVFFKCANQLLINFIDIAILVVSLLFHHLARDFQNSMKEQQLKSPAEVSAKVLSHFWRLRLFVNETVNKVYGPMILWYMLVAVLYYSCYLDSIFGEKNRIQQFRNTVYIVNFTATILFASDANYRISGLKDWILYRQHVLKLPESDVFIILSALSPCDVGIRAFGFFTVTYEFVSTVANVIVTYAVILLHFQRNDTEPLFFYGYNNLL